MFHQQQLSIEQLQFTTIYILFSLTLSTAALHPSLHQTNLKGVKTGWILPLISTGTPS